MRFFKHSASKKTASQKTQNAVLVTALISLLVACAGIWAINEAHILQIENITASTMAGEGIEAVGQIRNFNWIKYRENPEKCWLTLPQSTVCSDSTTITDGAYSLAKTTDISGWILTPATSSTTEAPDNENATAGDPLTTNETSTPPSPTNFSRLIHIKHVSADQVEISSTVSWQNRFGEQKTSFSTFLTNYLKNQ